jgi:hypothetical protein
VTCSRWALRRVARCLQRVCDLLQACNALRRTAKATRCRLVGGQREVLVRPLVRLFCLGDRLGGSPLFGGQRD